MKQTVAKKTRSAGSEPKPALAVRCAIYTRKSTEEGLEQEFNTLDAQRESGEAYVKSQVSAGWVVLSTAYDDGGYSGGNMDRPALKRLMSDVKAGLVDCVVVYKVDRLSRSLLDFSRIMEVFDEHQVAFVSVTQQISTANSMGRLMLNVLLSFAQFEREIIGERTRDKIAAARRKGKWSGGQPVLGYDIDPLGTKITVNEAEAMQVCTIFDLYIEHQSMITVLRELDRRGWLSKRWLTRKGPERGGNTFTKNSLHRLLTNVIYIGKVRYKDEVHPGEHPAIITDAVWKRTQTLLERNRRTGGAEVRNKFGAILKGLIRCKACNCAMVPSHTTRGQKRYRYYVCSNAQKRGWEKCPAKSIPAPEIERFVVDQIRRIGQDPDLIRETTAHAQAEVQKKLADLDVERRSLERDLAHWGVEIRNVNADVGPCRERGTVGDRLAELQNRVRAANERLAAVQEQARALSGKVLSHGEVADALAAFDPVWESLSPREQTRVVQLLVERVDYDGHKEKVAITFHAEGLRVFAEEQSK